MRKLLLGCSLIIGFWAGPSWADDSKPACFGIGPPLSIIDGKMDEANKTGDSKDQIVKMTLSENKDVQGFLDSLVTDSGGKLDKSKFTRVTKVYVAANKKTKGVMVGFFDKDDCGRFILFMDVDKLEKLITPATIPDPTKIPMKYRIPSWDV